MSNLPVRAMVLYKHGVGFFVREGAVNTDEVTLTFREDEINDVLKSLAVFDKAGGQVLGIHYQTPMDRAARLANTSVKLSDKASLRDLIRDLRGRDALLVFEPTPGTEQTVTGRIIGLDVQTGKETPPDTVSVLDTHGQVRVFRFDSLRTVTIKDSQSEHDLSYFLDTSMREDSRREVHVRLSEGDHDLAVYYVAPSPTWRVSYRLVAETDETGKTGKALLQGWGLFDNRLEEDLEDVQVTLVAGQPISFIYDLYASRIPHRPTVEDESRIAPGPVEFEAGVGGIPDFLADDAGMVEVAAAMPAPRARMQKSSSPLLGAISRDRIEQSTPAQAEAKETGETFQYIVTTPVSVKRGESALVPIIGSEIQYERELLYNGEKLPDHPVASLRFDNTTNFTLERGPITVVEDADYKGEAVVAFAKADNQVYLPYAVELGVKVHEQFISNRITNRLNIADSYFIFEEYQTLEVTYSIENTTSRHLTITIEAPIQNDFNTFDMSPPDVETLEHRRWRVEVPAHRNHSFIRKERRLTTRKEEVRRLNYRNLQGYFRNRWLDQSTFDQLSEMLDNLQLVKDASQQKKELFEHRQSIYEQQEQLRKNLGALQPTGQEATLRNRILTQLESTQDRLDEIEQAIQEAEQQIEMGNQRAEEIIAGLGTEK